MCGMITEANVLDGVKYCFVVAIGVVLTMEHMRFAKPERKSHIHSIAYTKVI